MCKPNLLFLTGVRTLIPISSPLLFVRQVNIREHTINVWDDPNRLHMSKKHAHLYLINYSVQIVCFMDQLDIPIRSFYRKFYQDMRGCVNNMQKDVKKALFEQMISKFAISRN